MSDRPLMRFNRSDEWPTVKALFDDAFGGETESALVDQLKQDGDLLFTIVAERADALIGAVCFSALTIDRGPDALQAAALAPIAVEDAARGEGVGVALVRAGLAQCRKRGLAAVVAVGHPRFFGRMGFSAAAEQGLSTPWNGPHAQVTVLSETISSAAGAALYPKAFGVDAPAAPTRAPSTDHAAPVIKRVPFDRSAAPPLTTRIALFDAAQAVAAPPSGWTSPDLALEAADMFAAREDGRIGRAKTG